MEAAFAVSGDQPPNLARDTVVPSQASRGCGAAQEKGEALCSHVRSPCLPPTQGHLWLQAEGSGCSCPRDASFCDTCPFRPLFLPLCHVRCLLHRRSFSLTLKKPADLTPGIPTCKGPSFSCRNLTGMELAQGVVGVPVMEHSERGKRRGRWEVTVR